MSLPPETSAEIFKELGPEEIQAITAEMSKLPQISPETREQVIQEFFGQVGDGGGAPKGMGGSFSGPLGNHMPGDKGGIGATQAMGGFGSSAFGGGGGGNSNRPLDFLCRVDPRQLLQLIGHEHPQTIAVVLYYIQPNQSAVIMDNLKPQVQTEVARRLAEMNTIMPEVLEELTKVLETRLHQALEEGSFNHDDGEGRLLAILNNSERNTEESVIAGLKNSSPLLVGELKTKLCDFEDLNNIDDSSLQQVLRLTDFRDLVLALKGAQSGLAQRVYRFLSPEVARALRDDVENLGQVPWEDIKQAQQQIRNILRGLVTLNKIKFK